MVGLAAIVMQGIRAKRRPYKCLCCGADASHRSQPQLHDPIEGRGLPRSSWIWLATMHWCEQHAPQESELIPLYLL